MSRVLIIDDEPSICWGFSELLGGEGHAVEIAGSAEEGIAKAAARRPDLVLLDVRLPGRDGLAALPDLRRHVGAAPVVVMTAFGDLDTAVRAVQAGAFDYLTKPFDLDDAARVVDRALRHEPPASPSVTVPPVPEGTLVGRGPAMQQVFKQIALVAGSDVPVLVTGESGTGKELVARAIHAHGPRAAGPFLATNLAALAPGVVESELFGHVRGAFTGAAADRKGLLELASGGTVLLDELGEAGPELQVKLLRALEQREVTPVGEARPRPFDARIIAATNRDLSELIRAGRFREDLYYRLSVFRIHLPPLRDRLDDLPELVDHFLARARPDGDRTVTPAALDALARRRWPGNLRELRNAIEHAAIVSRGRPIGFEHLPPATDDVPGDAAAQVAALVAGWTRAEADRSRDDPAGAALHDRFLAATEPALFRAALDACGGNKAAAATLLGLHRTTLRLKLRKYGLDDREDG